MTIYGKKFINAVGREVRAHGGATPASTFVPDARMRAAPEKGTLEFDIFGRLYDNAVPVFFPTGTNFVIDRLGNSARDVSNPGFQQLDIDSLIALQAKLGYEWGSNEHGMPPDWYLENNPDIALLVRPGYGTGSPPTPISVVEGGVEPVPYEYFDGDALNSNPQTAAILDPANYESEEGTITEVTYTISGVPALPTDTVVDGDSVSVRVTDSAGNLRYYTIDELVTYTAPVAGNLLVDQTFVTDTGIQTYATAFDFTGSDLTYSINNILDVTIDSLSLIHI